MRNLYSIFTFVIGVICSNIARAVTVPGADTPLFYLAGSSSGTANLTPLRLTGPSYPASFIGSGPIGKFYLQSSRFVALDPAGSSDVYFPVLNAVLGPNGCSNYGSISFLQRGSSNKCARYDGYMLQSNPENAQLGARLTNNFVGGFYVCGSNQDLWYKIDSADGPTDCTAIDLWAVPVSA